MELLWLLDLGFEFRGRAYMVRGMVVFIKGFRPWASWWAPDSEEAPLAVGEDSV
jgi:hypothetical protein